MESERLTRTEDMAPGAIGATLPAMSVHRAGGSSPFTAADAVLVLDARAFAHSVTAAVHAASPGARVVAVADRPGFLEALRAGPWALVIVSFDVPEFPGLLALRDARSLARAPMIALAAHPDPGLADAAIREGAEVCVARVRSNELAANVARLLERAAAQSGQGPDLRFARATAALAQRDAMVLLDRDWRVTDCSRGVTAVLGYQAADLVGQPVETLFAEAPESDAFLRRLLAWSGREPFGDSAWMVRRDGLRMWAEVTCVTDPGADGQAQRFCLAVRDATLHYRASHSLRNQADAAAAATAARNLFLASIAHELRGALAPISTSAIVLERKALEPAQLARLLGIVRRNAASAARLVEDLLTFSTASENKLVMRDEEVDLNSLVAECADAAQHPALAAQVALRVEFACPAAQARLKCDAERIRQVVVNLVGNAIKFTPPGGSVHVRTSCGEDGVEIEVIDTGAGIDPASLPFIFEPFEQGGANVTAQFGGFGLGLAVCSAIARQHGGSIVASSPGRGQGATFRLSLPRHGARPGPRGRPAHQPRTLRVLYVEDNADAADAMRYALASLGWTMTHAATCTRARELVGDAQHSFDVVLADLGLPDGSGLELGQELCRQLPVVALTAYGAPLGMQGFASQLIKPAEIGDVQRALLRAVAVHDRTTVP